MEKVHTTVPEPIVNIIDLFLYYGKVEALKKIALDISKKILPLLLVHPDAGNLP